MVIADKISAEIDALGDWRGDRLRELRDLINEFSPELTEDLKWGVPVWTKNTLVCAISAFKGHVKFNFFKGAHMKDDQNLFNSGLDSKAHRSINFSETDKLPKAALRRYIREAIAYDTT